MNARRVNRARQIASTRSTVPRSGNPSPGRSSPTYPPPGPIARDGAHRPDQTAATLTAVAKLLTRFRRVVLISVRLRDFGRVCAGTLDDQVKVVRLGYTDGVFEFSTCRIYAANGIERARRATDRSEGSNRRL